MERVGIRTRNAAQYVRKNGREMDFQLSSDTVPCSMCSEGSMILLKTAGNMTQHHKRANQTQDHRRHSWLPSTSLSPPNAKLQLMYNILDNNGKTFTNGSLSKEGKVTYGFILEYHKTGNDIDQIVTDNCVSSFNVVPGNNMDKNSYRGELAGILSAINA